MHDTRQAHIVTSSLPVYYYIYCSSLSNNLCSSSDFWRVALHWFAIYSLSSLASVFRDRQTAQPSGQESNQESNSSSRLYDFIKYPPQVNCAHLMVAIFNQLCCKSIADGTMLGTVARQLDTIKWIVNWRRFAELAYWAYYGW